MAYSLEVEYDEKGNEGLGPMSLMDGYMYNVFIPNDYANEIRFKIICDGDKEGLVSYYYQEYGGDKINVIQERDVLRVFIKPNLSNEDEEYSIVISHYNDYDINKVINITKEHKAYEINCGLDESILNEDSSDEGSPDETDPDEVEEIDYLPIEWKYYINEEEQEIEYEETTVYVKVNGGSEDYRIKSIKKYRKTDDDEDDGLFISNFDNDFEVIKVSKEKLILRNYGFPFYPTVMDIEADGSISYTHDITDFYYIIELCHKDDVRITSKIKINYEQKNDNDEGGGSEAEGDVTYKDDSSIYDNTNATQTYSIGNEGDDENEEEDKYILEIDTKFAQLGEKSDNKNGIQITKQDGKEFKLRIRNVNDKNYVTTNYYVNAYSSASWCSLNVKYIEGQNNGYNWILTINLTNVSNLDRRCVVRLTVPSLKNCEPLSFYVEQKNQ